jgi:hypothetical protein
VRFVVVALAVSGAVLGIVLSSVGGSAGTVARLPHGSLPSASSACVSPLPATAPASPADLRGYTYVLAPKPRDYEVLSEAGTMSGSGCPGAVWWSVTYDRVSGYTMLSGVDVIVTSAAAGVALNPMVAPGSTAVPIGSAAPGVSEVTLGGHRGLFHDLGDGVGRLVWIANGVTFAVDGPISGGQPEALLNLAKTLTLVSPTNPAIQACLSQLRGPCEDPS